MVNGIKLEEMGLQHATNKVTSSVSVPKQASAANSSSTKSAGVVVTSQMNQLVTMMLGDDQAPDESARVQAVKAQVQAGEYHINISALADKLMSTVLSNS